MTDQSFKFLNNYKLADVITADTLQNWGLEVGTGLGIDTDQYNFRTWYYEEINNKDRLVITVGDSWTWGDHLGNIDWDKAIDDPIRLKQVFGKLLADKLNADWVNIAMPGCSNYWMLGQLELIEQHLHRVKDQYKQIDIVVTLTEDLRETTHTEPIDIDRVYKYLWSRSKSLNGFLIKVEDFLMFNIEHFAQKIPFVNIHVSRAFTDFWPQTQSELMLDKTWCDVINANSVGLPYAKTVPFIGQLSINPLTERFIQNDNEMRHEFLDIMEHVTKRWEFLGQSEYNLKGSTCHPNPAGHALWSNYLFTKLR
jgi:hypothetical protein